MTNTLNYVPGTNDRFHMPTGYVGKPIPVINYSEFDTLSSCEEKWKRAYILGQEPEPGNKTGLHRGTLLHLALGRWQNGLGATLPEVWTDDINTGGKPGVEQTLRLTDFDVEVVESVLWLLERYVEHYGSAPPSSWNVITSEEWLTRDFGSGTGRWTLVGRTDGAVEIDGQLWLLERKSYGSKGRLDYVGVDPQLAAYCLLYEAKHGVRPFGVIYDGIYTYQWALKKPTQAQCIEEGIASGVTIDGTKLEFLTKKLQTEWARAAVERHPGVQTHEASESFDRREIELGDGHLAAARAYLAGAVRRQRVVLRRPSDAIPNVGRDCSWCDFKKACWADLGGVDEESIYYDDSED